VLADRVGGLDGLLKKKADRQRKRGTGTHDPDELAMATAADHADVDHDYDDHDDEDADLDGDDAMDDEFDDVGHTGQGMKAGTAEHTGSYQHDVPDDTELEERVLEAFHNDPVLAERAIDIGAIGTGVIELTGWVQASWEIGHAVTLARGVPDVTTVVDRLAVRDGEKRRDHSGRNYAGTPVAETPAPVADRPLPRAD
jgi:hypothetical protein